MKIKCTKCNGEKSFEVYGAFGKKKCTHCNGKGFNSYNN